MVPRLCFGPPVYSSRLGFVTVEVYRSAGGFKVFIVGEQVVSYLGYSTSLEDCMAEISSLEDIVNSERFRQEVGKYS